MSAYAGSSKDLKDLKDRVEGSGCRVVDLCEMSMRRVFLLHTELLRLVLVLGLDVAPPHYLAKREQREALYVLFPESQLQNLALTVLYVPYSLDGGSQRLRQSVRQSAHTTIAQEEERTCCSQNY